MNVKKARKAQYLPAGSIASDTTRPEDVIPELLDLSKQVRLSRQDRRDVERLRKEWRERENAEAVAESNRAILAEEEKDSILIEITDILTNYCPPFCFLGNHQDDGADFGIWPDIDIALSAVDDGEVYLIDESNTRRAVERGNPLAPYRLHISDHGNASLFTKKGRDLW